MSSFEMFLSLHHSESPLLIGNAWDVTSATIFERSGFKAVATSSSAIAHTLGYEDGENMPFDLLLETVKRISSRLTVPFSVDMEAGYSRGIPGVITNLEKLYDLGVVGFNLEDSVIHERGKIQPAPDFQEKISSIMNHLSRKNMKMFLNARTDAFLLGLPSPLSTTIERIKAYEQAGASGVFVPFITNLQDIKEVVGATRLPVNVLCRPALPGFKELAALGVKRISMGGALHKALVASMEKMLGTVREDQSFSSLY
jgi:2-methylisocitrate lyase-like PEP mutase family enzyme